MHQIRTRAENRLHVSRVEILQLLAVENAVILSVENVFFTLLAVYGVKAVHS